MRRWIQRLVWLSLFVALLGGWTAGDDRVVLGEKGRYGPNGIGWGTVAPRLIDNGNRPGRRAWNLSWTRWGGPAAIGRGLTWIPRPGGGYYGRPGTIWLRASRIGRCSPGGPRAYLRLQARAPARPGGPHVRWYLWAGSRDLCRP